MPGYFMYYSGIYGWGRGSRLQGAGFRVQVQVSGCRLRGFIAHRS